MRGGAGVRVSVRVVLGLELGLCLGLGLGLGLRLGLVCQVLRFGKNIQFRMQLFCIEKFIIVLPFAFFGCSCFA